MKEASQTGKRNSTDMKVIIASREDIDQLELYC